MHYDNASETKSEWKPDSDKAIVERTKLRTQRFDEIAENEKTINPELFKICFDYPSPTGVYKVLDESKNLEENKAQVNKLDKLQLNIQMETFKTFKILKNASNDCLE